MLTSARPTRRDAPTVSSRRAPAEATLPTAGRLTADTHSWKRDTVGRCRVLAERRQELLVPCRPCRTRLQGFPGRRSRRDVVAAQCGPRFKVSRGSRLGGSREALRDLIL